MLIMFCCYNAINVFVALAAVRAGTMSIEDVGLHLISGIGQLFSETEWFRARVQVIVEASKHITQGC